jgi:hypothetical protein
MVQDCRSSATDVMTAQACCDALHSDWPSGQCGSRTRKCSINVAGDAKSSLGATLPVSHELLVVDDFLLKLAWPR